MYKFFVHRRTDTGRERMSATRRVSHKRWDSIMPADDLLRYLIQFRGRHPGCNPLPHHIKHLGYDPRGATHFFDFGR
jgi:hypothetical protein